MTPLQAYTYLGNHQRLPVTMKDGEALPAFNFPRKHVRYDGARWELTSEGMRFYLQLVQNGGIPAALDVAPSKRHWRRPRFEEYAGENDLIIIELACAVARGLAREDHDAGIERGPDDPALLAKLGLLP